MPIILFIAVYIGSCYIKKNSLRELSWLVLSLFTAAGIQASFAPRPSAIRAGAWLLETMLLWLGCKGFFGIGSGIATKRWGRFWVGLSVIGIPLIIFVLVAQSRRHSSTDKVAISSEEKIRNWPFHAIDEHLGLFFPAEFTDLPASEPKADTDTEWLKSAHSFGAKTQNMTLTITKSKAPTYGIDQALALVTNNFQRAHSNLSVQLEPVPTPDNAKARMEILTVDVNGRKGKVTVLIIIQGQTQYFISGSGNDDAFDELVHETIRDYRWQE